MNTSQRGSGDSYYGRPILKEPVWKPEIGWYLFTGGLGGASATLSLAARISGNPRLARTSSVIAAGAINVSPPLLIKDLGRPERFLNMLRVFKPTSPMNVGSWLLLAMGGAQTTATACEVTGRLPRLRTLAQVCSALGGPALSTYTAALLSDTAVPVWHEARRELPVVFAASSCASAGAAAVLIGDPAVTGPARRLALLGACGELLATNAMDKRLGMLGEPYHSGTSGLYAKASKAATALGVATTAFTGRRGRRAGAALILAGAALQRFSVLKAGSASARDPRYTVEPQRDRLNGRQSDGGVTWHEDDHRARSVPSGADSSPASPAQPR